MQSPSHLTHGSGFVHDAVFFESQEELLAITVPFVEEGVALDEPVLIAAGSEHDPAYREIFADHPLVKMGDGATYRNPLAAASSFEGFFRRGLADGVRRFRVIGAVDYYSDPYGWREWIRYEAFINHVLADYPVHGLCPYDTRQLSAEIIRGARLAHPGIFGVAGRSSNEAYVDPQRLLADADYRLAPDPLERGAPSIELADVHDPADLRMDLYLATLQVTSTAMHTHDFVFAVNEVVTNALCHGRRPVSVKVWIGEARLVGVVTDQGAGIDDRLLGFRQPRRDGTVQHLGMWGVRQLCSAVDYGSTPEGFSVRLVVDAAASN